MPFPLNLVDLAQGGLDESQRRGQAGMAANASALQTGLAQQGAQDQSQADAALRDQTFQHAQAILAEALARREETMQQADAMARQRFDEQQASLQRTFLGGEASLNRSNDYNVASLKKTYENAGQPDWYSQQRFQTDENIRQAKALGDLSAADEEAKSKPRLSDFGSSAINPYRGQALLSAGTPGLTPEELKRAQKYLKESDFDPAQFQQRLREKGWKPKKASIAMWNLLGGTI